MAVIDRKTIVVIDDNIYDLMEFYKSVLFKKEFGFLSKNIKYIKLSDLSAAIPADRIDDFGVYFYVFEKINTEEEYLSVTEKLRCTPNIEIAILHCQDSRSFEVCDCQKKNLCKIHCISVSEKFVLDKEEILTEKELQERNCLRLSACLFYLLCFQEGSFSDYAIQLELNYPSIYCAAQYPILQMGTEIDAIEKKIKEEQKKVKKLLEEKPYKYSVSFAELKVDGQQGNPSVSGQNLGELAVTYGDYEKDVEKIIEQDIEAARYAMAEIDEYAQGGPEPGCFKNKEKVQIVPDAKDLLRNVAIGEDNGFNIKQAILIAKNFLKIAKPKMKPFLVAGGIAISVFLLCVATIYGASVIKSGVSSVDINLLITCLCVPVAIILIAGIAGFIASIAEYKKIEKILMDLASSIDKLSKGISSFVENVREYINDFITVFCNYHAKYFCISEGEKRISLLEKEKNEKIAEINEINSFPDTIKVLFEYEQSLYSKNNNFDNEPTVDKFKKTDIGIDYTLDAFAYEDSEAEQTPDAEQAASKDDKPGLVKFDDCKKCVQYIKAQSDTQVDGNKATPFEDTHSPWLSAIKISGNMNGGIL